MSPRDPRIRYPHSDPPVELRETLAEVTNDGIGIIRMNRPDVKNAMTRQLAFEVTELLETMNEDDEVRAVILTGVGESFCAGAYIKGSNLYEGGKTSHAESLHRYYPIPNQTRNVRIEPTGWWGVMVKTLYNYSKPVIAAVNGPAYGGGLGLTCACDFRIASDKAAFASIFIRRALSVEVGVSFFLPRIIGFPKALSMVMTGRTVGAQEALALGLADRVVPHEKLMDEALQFARELTVDKPLVALAITRRVMYHSLEVNNLAAQLAIEQNGTEVTDNQAHDRAEAFQAFAEKRPAKYTGD